MLFAFLPLWLSIWWRPHRCLALQLIAPVSYPSFHLRCD